MDPAAPRLVMYATSWCADCARARRFLRAHGVEWREVDVDRDAEADARVQRLNRGARLLPVLVIGRRRMTAAPFEPKRLARWLVEAGVASRDQLSGAGPSGPGR